MKTQPPDRLLGRATIWRSTVLLGGVEPVVSDPRDELAAVPDIIATDDGEDFSAFATSRWPGLVRLAFGLTGDRWMAEDIAQTALAKAYVAWRRVSRADDPDAYLRRILVNASNRRFRRRRVTEQPGDPPETAVDGPADLVSERAALLAALRQLPPRQRAVVVLRYWEDLTDAQIAAALGCSPGTVRSQLSRALAKLRVSSALGEGDDG
jgi:RNA polymerase sigma-70 factor (sigma-E family)